MSAKHPTYSLTSPNAVHANHALNHAYWAVGATIFVMVLHTVAPRLPTVSSTPCGEPGCSSSSRRSFATGSSPSRRAARTAAS